MASQTARTLSLAARAQPARRTLSSRGEGVPPSHLRLEPHSKGPLARRARGQDALATIALSAVIVVASFASIASAQSTVPYNGRHMMLKPWEPDAYVESSDRIVYQEQGHLK